MKTAEREYRPRFIRALLIDPFNGKSFLVTEMPYNPNSIIDGGFGVRKLRSFLIESKPLYERALKRSYGFVSPKLKFKIEFVR